MIFPSGLVLYWTVNNLLSMLQQWVVNTQLATSKKN
jgi:YidC/Oxa1 family membrane protein insertase